MAAYDIPAAVHRAVLAGTDRIPTPRAQEDEVSTPHAENCDPDFGCDEKCTTPLPPCTCGGVSADFGRGYDTGIAAAYRGEQNRINAVVLQYVIGLPARIKSCRAANGLSLRDAAKQTGLSAMTLSRIENGADYDVESLVALAAWAGQVDPAARLCRRCPESGRPMTRAARNATCCEHAASDHDTHGCAVNLSTHSRTYERCHGLVTADLSSAERAVVDRIEQAPDAPEALRERVAEALYNEFGAVTVRPWSEATSLDRDGFRIAAQIAIDVIRTAR